MSTRTLLWLTVIAAALMLAAGARAADPSTAPHDHGDAAQSCAHHQRAMQGMHSDKERTAYCQAHEECVRHDCGGMAAKGRGPVDPPGPKPKSQEKPKD